MNKHDIKTLKQIYLENKLVPFIGAGLSRPFRIPDWKSLLIELNKELIEDIDIQKMILEEIISEKYWEAVDDIINYSFKDERYIQQMVVNILNTLMIKDVENQDSNYRDLNILEVPYYITTNYDNLLGRHIKGIYQTTILNNSDASTQQWARDKKGKRIIHLHGDIANFGTIVLSKKSYDDIYSSKKYKELFNFFRSGYTFLFLGFSFSDQYIINLMNEYAEIFNDYHYILLANPTDELRRKYMKKYKLHVIGYNVSNINDNNEHIEGIRKFLKEITEGEEENF